MLVASWLDGLIEMQGIHDMFHTSFFNNNFGEQRQVVMEPSNIQLQPNLSYKKCLIQIVDQKD